MHPGWALTLSLAVAAQPGPSSPADADLLSELEAKVAVIVGTTTPPPKISINCANNVRERVCTAEIGSGAARQVVIVTRPLEPLPGDQTTVAIPMVLQLRPVIAQATPILDVAIVARRLLVLDPAAVTLYDSTAAGWRRIASYPVVSFEPWPRDVRGRLVVQGSTWEAFIPGGTCRGSLDPFRGECTREPRSWPLGIENAGLAPRRNNFALADGQKYFGIASLGPTAGARWMLATDDNRLMFIDEQRAATEIPGLIGDDVAAISSACTQGTHVVIAGTAGEGGVDALRVARVAERQVTTVAFPVTLAGRITALWPTAAGDAALVVVRDPTRGYEAFHAGLACGR